MNILITGGAGYVGCSLVDSLVKQRSIKKIIVYDNLSRNNYNFFFGNVYSTKVRFIQGDILDSYQLKNALKKIDVVIHLAAYVAFPYNHLQNMQYEQINRWGTQSVVRLSEESRSVKHFLYLSTTAVYGFQNSLDINSEENPQNAYASSKYEAEKYVKKMGKSYSIIRSGNVFGFNRCIRLDSVVNKLFFDAISKKKIFIYGNGHQKRPFVYLDHLINQICDWIFKGKCHPIAVDFNSSLNDLRDFLLSKSQGMEYQYLNHNQEFPGQSFNNYDDKDVMFSLLNDYFLKMDEALTIK